MPDLVNPITGTHNKLSVGTIIGMVLATAVGFFVVAGGQNLANKAAGKFGLDATIDPLVADRPKAVASFKRFVS